MSNAAEFLAQAQNVDGGWGYRVRGMSYVEPTATVILALRDQTAQGRARDFLLSLQRADGGWGIGVMDSESGWMTAWAVHALADFPEARDSVARGVSWLVATEGVRLTDAVSRARIRGPYQMDSALRGWPWQRGDAAWVHPTALAILALRRAQGRLFAHPSEFILSEVEGRVHDGVQYLLDRAVPSGGWNIGNPWMLDKQLPATVQDTAIALLAWRAVGDPSTWLRMDDAPITRAIEFLRGAVGRAKTSAELAWGVYALRNWGVDVGDALARLNALQDPDGSWQGNPFITAIAMKAGG
jgi:hypothetical protein